MAITAFAFLVIVISMQQSGANAAAYSSVNVALASHSCGNLRILNLRVFCSEFRIGFRQTVGFFLGIHLR